MSNSETDNALNVSSKEIPTSSNVALLGGENVSLDTASLTCSPMETNVPRRGANVPSSADALNPVEKLTHMVLESDAPAKETESKTSTENGALTEVVTNPKKEKKRRQKERKRMMKAMEGVSVAGKMGTTEGMVIAGPSGVNYNLVKESPPCREESRKRGHIAGDTPEVAIKKQKQGNHSQTLKKTLTLRVVCKDDSREISPDDTHHITSVIDDRIIEETISCHVHKSYLQPNCFHLVCGDQVTVDWLKEIINQLPGPTGIDNHPGYPAMAPGDRPPMKRFFAWVPGNRDPGKTLKLLGVCNESLDIKKIIIKAVIPGEGGQMLVLGVKHDLLGYLAEREYRLFCGAIGSIQLTEPNPKIQKRESNLGGLSIQGSSGGARNTTWRDPSTIYSASRPY